MNSEFDNQIDEWSKNFDAAVQGFVKGLGLDFLLEAIFSMFFAGIWILLVNVWWDDINFITEEFEELVTLITAAGLTTIVLYTILLIFRSKIIHYFVQTTNNLISIFIIYRMIRIFPFEFGGFFEFLNDWGKTLLVVLTIIICISILSSTINLFKEDSSK